MPFTTNQAAYAATVRANRVFILGAGFSASAGVPLTNELLRKALCLFKRDCPGIYSRVEGYALESLGSDSKHLDVSKLNFSDLCTFLEFIELREYGGGERWSENGSREKIALRYYLARTLVENTPCPNFVPELYRRFANQLQQQDFVISFNWDGLLEAALTAVGKSYTYDASDPNAITISKLHGSVNWRLGEPRTLDGKPPRLLWQALDFGSGMMKQTLYHCLDPLRIGTWEHFGPLSEIDPYLVLPGYGKAFDVRANAAIWYKPEAIFAYTHDVYIIGLSLAPDDFFVRSFFLSNLPYLQQYSGVSDRRLVIINPSDAVRSDYAFVLGQKFAEHWPEPFSIKHIDRIRAASGI